MPDPTALLAILAAFFLVTVSPGPANLACAAVAMRHGRGAGLRFGLGLAAGLALWGGLAAAGMGAVLQASEQALFALKLLGAAYLLWLAYGSARGAVVPAADGLAPTHGQRWFAQGLLLNLSNPKAVFAWMAALAVGLDPGAGGAAVLTATVLCACLGVINYVGWATLFSNIRIREGYARARRWIDGVIAGLFAVAGLGLLRSAFAR